MAHLSEEVIGRARQLVSLYPEPRSALIPVCHLAQEQDGWLHPEAIEEIATMVGVSPAEVFGTASFYDLLHTEPTGRYVVSICTNIACMLAGAYDLLDHAEKSLDIRAGGTTSDGLFTLEEAECIADCDNAPCLQVNGRYFGKLDRAEFDKLVEDLRAGEMDEQVPPHGTLCRIRRSVGLTVGSAAASTSRDAVGDAGQDSGASTGTAGTGASRGISGTGTTGTSQAPRRRRRGKK
ncbi:MAG: NADH-quinone oxidoreductase subunit NuoE family protein [Acidimicrobiales bacterium]